MKILECVPNFSEGRNPDLIRQIAGTIEAVKGIALLDVDSSYAANRTVMTFVGDPESVYKAAYQAISLASELIDMTEHKGVHPRIGACDVCPFVPIADMTMDECVVLSEKLGEKVGHALKIPVYLYAYSAHHPERGNLSFLRQGQYEGLAARMAEPDFKPDFGPEQFNKQCGATVIGARDLLIAYNINLATSESVIANRIAARMRKIRGAINPYDGFSGDREAHHGLKSVNVIGWAVPEFKLTQVSINLLNYRWFGLFDAYSQVKKLAEQEGIELAGSEVVGLLPKESVIAAAERLLTLEDPEANTAQASEEELIKVAIDQLDLSAVKTFDPQVKILDYQLEKLDMLLNI